MSVFIVNVGGSQVDVNYTKVQESAPVYVGDLSRSFNGAERTSVRASARQFTLTTGIIDSTTESNLRTQIGLAAQIPCAGDLFNNGGANVTCSVRVTGRVPVIGTSFWQLTLAVSVVTAT